MNVFKQVVVVEKCICVSHVRFVSYLNQILFYWVILIMELLVRVPLDFDLMYYISLFCRGLKLHCGPVEQLQQIQYVLQPSVFAV